MSVISDRADWFDLATHLRKEHGKTTEWCRRRSRNVLVAEHDVLNYQDAAATPATPADTKEATS